MSMHKIVRMLGLVSMVGLSVGMSSIARAQTSPADNRLLPNSDDIAVSMDDAVLVAKESFPSLKLADTKVTRHGSRWVYQIQMLANRGNKVRTIKIDCSSGQTIVNRSSTGGPAVVNRLRSEVQRLAAVAVDKADAIRIAEEAVPGAKAYEVELDDLNDQPVFKVKLLDGDRRVIVYVSASSGSVVDQSNDGVVNLSLDEAAARALELYPEWTVVKVELDDDRGFDDSGAYYNVRIVNAAGTQRRELKIDANTGTLLRDRLKSVGSGQSDDYQQIGGITPEVTPAKAATIATDSLPGSRVREISLQIRDGVLVYNVHLITATGGEAEVKVNAMTGDVVVDDNGGGGGGGGMTTITYTQAAMIASELFPTLRVREVELEVEDSGTFYKVNMVDANGVRTDVFINATTGAVVGTPSGGGGGGGGGATLTYAEAAQIASDRFPELSVREVEIEVEDGVTYFKVQMISATGVRSNVFINAATGLVVDNPSGGGGGGGGGGSGPVDADQAAAIGLAMFPGSTVREISTDTEEGVPVYEVSLNTSSGRVDLKIAIATGEVIRVRTR